MEEIKLDVQIRSQFNKRGAKEVRREDMIPGIVYGGNKTPTAIKFDRGSYEKIRRQHQGEVVFHIKVLEEKKALRDYSAIVKEEQHHAVSDQILHVDFKRISLKERLKLRFL